MSTARGCCLIVAVSVQSVGAAAADPEREWIVNGDFSEWENDEPVGWTLGIGAKNGGEAPLSHVEPTEDGGLLLSGNSGTMAWRTVSQSIGLESGTFLRVTLETRAKGLKRQGRQYDNCYAGLLLKESDELQSRQYVSPTADWAQENLYVRVPQSAGDWSAELLLFLSKTGEFEIREITVAEMQPEDSFQLLVGEMDRHYSHFASKDVDWPALTAQYRERVDSEPDQFNEITLAMLGELGDMHVWIVDGDGKQLPSHRSGYTPNFNPRGPVADDFQDRTDIPGLGYVGTTADGYGLIGIDALQADQGTIAAFDRAVAGILDAPGILIDLRRNSGGSEPLGGYIVGLFADRRRAYAGSVVRNGPEHDDFTEMRLRYLEPRRIQEAYSRPVVCLIGPGCVSSGEGMAMMLKCLPHVTLVGQPTRGASGNPQPLPLPNGVDVWFSRWVSLLPDGTPIEGRGIQPDVLIEYKDVPGRPDPTFDRAVEILEDRLADE